jgi:FkbM family methyltransferase
MMALYGLSKVSHRAWVEPCLFSPAGIALWARPQDWLALDEVFTGREYGFVEDLPIDERDPVIVDLGANIGAFSAFVLGRWPAASVYSVEASADTARLLERNRGMNRMFHWKVYHYALWSHDGYVNFQEGGPSTGRRVQGNGGGAQVPALTYSTLLRRLELEDRRIGILKMDVEGAEASVLAQAGSWIDRVDHLIVEVHPPASAPEVVLQYLKSSFRTVREVPRSSSKPLMVASR